MELEQEAQVSLEEALERGRRFLDSSEPQECIQLLAPVALERPNEAELLPLYQLLGEAFLELGSPKEAYDLFTSCAELDSDGQQGGIEKFLWLGQLTGGREGENWYQKGIQGLRQSIATLTSGLGQSDKIKTDLKFKTQKLCEALCGIVEIWMTDLW